MVYTYLELYKIKIPSWKEIQNISNTSISSNSSFTSNTSISSNSSFTSNTSNTNYKPSTIQKRANEANEANEAKISEIK
jgi:hypothetical protein